MSLQSVISCFNVLSLLLLSLFIFFFFNDTATTEIYTLSLHDALPISSPGDTRCAFLPPWVVRGRQSPRPKPRLTLEAKSRSEEHTSELQSRRDLVCRLLLEKKNKIYMTTSKFTFMQ